VSFSGLRLSRTAWVVLVVDCLNPMSADRLEDGIYCGDESLSEEVAMSLFATKVMVFSLLASAAAFAQAGDPSASRALQTRTSQDSQTIKITRSGERFSTKAPASTSQVPQVLIVFFTENPASHTSGAIVAFEPGARTAWHSHPLGQTLIVTAVRVGFSSGAVKSKKFGKGTSSGFRRA